MRCSTFGFEFAEKYFFRHCGAPPLGLLCSSCILATVTTDSNSLPCLHFEKNLAVTVSNTRHNRGSTIVAPEAAHCFDRRITQKLKNLVDTEPAGGDSWPCTRGDMSHGSLVDADNKHCYFRKSKHVPNT